METLESTVGDHLLRYSDGVFELFGRRSFDSTRIPVQWLTVGVGEPKRGEVLIRFSRRAAPGDPLYRSLPGKKPSGESGFTIPVALEADYREFFTRVAAATGRTVSP